MSMITIKLGGQLRSLRFNNYQKEALGKLYGKDPLECAKIIADKWETSLMRAGADLIYTGLIGDYEAKLKDLDFTREDVAEWVGDASDEDVAAAIKAWWEVNQVRLIIKEKKVDKADATGKGTRKKKAVPKN